MVNDGTLSGATSKYVRNVDSNNGDSIFHRSSKPRKKTINIGKGKPIGFVNVYTKYATYGVAGFLNKYADGAITVESIKMLVKEILATAYEIGMQLAYIEIMQLFNQGISQFYGQHDPEYYKRFGDLYVANQSRINGHGLGTTIDIDINSGQLHSFNYDKDAVLDMIMNGVRIMGVYYDEGGKRHAKFDSWSFKYSGVIAAAGTLNQTFDMIDSKWSEFFTPFFEQGIDHALTMKGGL